MANTELDHFVLRQLQVGASESRVQLARQLDVSPSTMGIHIDRMLQRGLLCEDIGGTASAESVTIGRPPKVLQLNPEVGQFVGIDLDARNIFAVSVDFAQRRLNESVEVIAAKDRATDVLRRITQAIRSVLDPRRPLLGIGIASPGSVDAKTGVASHYEFIRDWVEVELAKHFSSAFDVPVCVENNARVMVLAEQAFGKAKLLESVICIGNRSGIGAGILIDGQLYRGPDGLAGEIGRWPIRNARGAICTLEEAASLRNIMNRLAAQIRDGRQSSLVLYRNQVTWSAIMNAINDRDSLTQSTLIEAAQVLGQSIAQMCLLLNPQRVIICGPLADLETAFLQPLRQSVAGQLPKKNAAVPDIHGSELGQFVGSLGAAAMAAWRWKPELN